MRPQHTSNLILSQYPFSRGFAFVLFEAAKCTIDWGVKEIKEKHRNDKMLAAIMLLVDKYCPAAVAIEETDGHRISPHTTWEHFAAVGAITKYEVAKAVVRKLPNFAHRMPSIRKPSMSADPRQSLFDAAALGLVFYRLKGTPSPYDGVDA